MPVVIALLNSYGGLADAAMGFVLMNKIQIVTGLARRHLGLPALRCSCAAP
jgi:NAD/NADP transhydrogenase beta subunit